MGFGNAAGSFMTGFMAGYKFIDDAEKKQQEINALKQKGEVELVNEKNKFIEGQNKLTRELELDFDKLDKDMNEEIKDISNPDMIISIRNNYDNKKAIRTSTYNDTIRAQADSVANTPLLQFARPVIGYNSSKLFKVKAEDGTSFVVSDSSAFGKKLQEDLKNPVDERRFIIDENGYVSTINVNGEKVNLDINGNTAKDDTSAIRLQNINQLITKKPEAITDNTPYPQNKIDDALKKRLTSVGMTPDTNGNFPNLTYGEVQNANKVLMNTYTFEARPMYSSDGKTIISVTNTDEYNKALAKGYSPNKPEKMTIPDIKLQQYFKSDAFKKGLTYDYWESREVEVGKSMALQGSLKSEEIGDTVKLTKVTPEFQRQYSESLQKVNSYQVLTDLINSAELGQKNGAFNQGPFNTLWNDIIKYTPAEMQEELSGKTQQQLMEQYKIDAAAADFVNRYVLFMTGQAATDAQTQRYIDTVIGSKYTNPQSAIFKLKSFKTAMETQINKDAKMFSNAGLTDFEQNWNDIRGGSKTVYSGGGEGGGQKPAKKGNKKPIWDPYLNKKGQ